MTHYADIAFTGARQGLSMRQAEMLEFVLSSVSNNDTYHHNGCAEGADESCLRRIMLREYGRIHLWPCNETRRQWVFNFVLDEGLNYFVVENVLPPLVRNRRMVDASSLLIACPAGPETPRGGTWYTIRYARKKGIPIKIIWPDGHVTEESA